MTIASAISALMTGPALRYCRTWKVERTDGRVILATNHSRTLRIGRDRYTPIGGVAQSSAIEQSADAQAHDVQVSGLFNSGMITQDDIRSGRYDEARVTSFLVDWLFVDSGVLETSLFWIDGVSWSGSLWSVELSGFSRFLDRSVGSVYAGDCERTLGDAGCKVDLGAIATGVVEVTSLPEVDAFGQSARRVFASTQVTGLTDGWFDFGAVRWITGANRGIVSTVQSYVSATGLFALQQRLPFDIQTTDLFVAVPGCDRQQATCKDKFNNVVNGLFYPHMKGTEVVLLTVN